MENMKKHSAKSLSLEEMQARNRPDDWFDNADHDDVLPVEESKQKNTHGHRIRRWLSLDELERTDADNSDKASKVADRNNATVTEEEEIKWLKKSKISEDDKERFNSYAGREDEKYTPQKRMRTISIISIAVATLAMLFTSLIMYSIQGGIFVHFTWYKGTLVGMLIAGTIPPIHNLITSDHKDDKTSKALSWTGSVFLAVALTMVIYSVVTLFTPQESVEYTPQETQTNQEEQ